MIPAEMEEIVKREIAGHPECRTGKTAHVFSPVPF